MTHSEILKQFEKMFPNFAGPHIKAWFPHGKNCIRIRHNNNNEYIFTFVSPKDWRFETATSFLKK